MFRSNDNSIDDQDDDSDNKTLGTITLIVGNRENKHPSVVLKSVRYLNQPTFLGSRTADLAQYDFV